MPYRLPMLGELLLLWNVQELKENEQQGPCCQGTDINVDELLDDPELERLHRCAHTGQQQQYCQPHLCK
jgi:hypothetical protein